MCCFITYSSPPCNIAPASTLHYSTYLIPPSFLPTILHECLTREEEGIPELAMRLCQPPPQNNPSQWFPTSHKNHMESFKRNQCSGPRPWWLCNMSTWLGWTTFPRIPSPARVDHKRDVGAIWRAEVKQWLLPGSPTLSLICWFIWLAETSNQVCTCSTCP